MGLEPGRNPWLPEMIIEVGEYRKKIPSKRQKWDDFNTSESQKHGLNVNTGNKDNLYTLNVVD